MKILVFGNPLLKNDSIPLQLIPKLQKEFPEIAFQDFDPTENLEKEGKNLIILDTIQGLKKIKLIESIDQISKTKIYSMHDFDLGYNLKLLKKIGKIDSAKIIGIPMKISKEKALTQIKSILRKCAAQLIQGS